MTITTHTRVQRGYYRRYYAENRDDIRPRERENKRCRYRRGWANWLMAELRAYWSAETMGVSQKTLDAILYSLPTSSQWMTFACVGRSKHSTGKSETQIRSTG